MDDRTKYAFQEAVGEFLKTLTLPCFFLNCKEPTIKAHSIQKNRILDKISSQGKVYSFDEWFKLNIDLEFNLVPIGKATIFLGFCNTHDHILFRPIEDNEYAIDNKEQNFLFAYRAMAKEYTEVYKSIQVYKSILGSPSLQKVYSDLVKSRGLNPSEEILGIQSRLKLAQSDLYEIEKERLGLEYRLERRDFFNITSKPIVFNNTSGLAVSSASILKRKNVFTSHRQFLTIFPQLSKTFVIFAFYKRDGHFFDFLNEHLHYSDNEKQLTISNFVAHCTKNLILSPEVWAKMPTQEKILFRDAFEEGHFNDNWVTKHRRFNLFSTL